MSHFAGQLAELREQYNTTTAAVINFALAYRAGNAEKPAKEREMMKPDDKFKSPRKFDQALRRYWRLTEVIETNAGKRYLFDIVDSHGKTTGFASRMKVSDLEPLE